MSAVLLPLREDGDMKKRTLTLLEIMIVIMLIALITGVIGYNMKGALDKGRAFRTERAQEQLHDLLLYRSVDQHVALEDLIKKNPEQLKKELEQTGLVKKAEDLLHDGWGEEFALKLSRDKKDVSVVSKKKIEYDKKTRSQLSEELEVEE
jgi:general secretion pathway protein G